MSTETEKKEIVLLEQMPIITHRIKEAGLFIKERIDGLELDKQIATEQSVQSLKTLRSELNKEFEDYETQRKAVKAAISAPYNEFEEAYKPSITEQYTSAKTLLTSKIDEYELKIKKDKENNVKEYFDELVLAEKIDFLKFENVGLKIDLSTSEKKFKEKVYAFIEKTNDDIALIKATDYEAETMAEYKKTLNVSKAITDVKARKEAEQAEAERIKAERTQSRKSFLSKLGLNYVEITNSYEFNADIYVTLSDIINLSKEDFQAKYAEIQAKIKAIKDVETSTENQTVIEEPKQKISTPISAPTVQKPIEEIKTASFEAKATMSKLRALGQYMKDNGIEYKNI